MDKIKEIVSKYDKNFIIEDEKMIFKIQNELVIYNTNKKRLYMDQKHFGHIPHILSDGSVCISGNDMISFKESDEEIKLDRCLGQYIPWLLNLPTGLKVAELINEITYYINVYIGGKAKRVSYFGKYDKKIGIATTISLWQVIDNLEENVNYKLYVYEYEEYAVYIRKENGTYKVSYDNYLKACQRVNGLKFKQENEKSCFIGVGSVNSYIIKLLFSKGLTDLILIDDDSFEIGNIFRFAFPYQYLDKIDCVKTYAKILKQDNIKIEGIKIKIDSDTRNVIQDCKKIYIAVDNMESIIDCFVYVLKNMSEDTEIILVGIDAFGGFGKYIKCKGQDNLKKGFIEFIDFENDVERRPMIGNGCGKALAIYDEMALIKLAKSVIKDDKREEVVKIEFED